MRHDVYVRVVDDNCCSTRQLCGDCPVYSKYQCMSRIRFCGRSGRLRVGAHDEGLTHHDGFGKGCNTTRAMLLREASLRVNGVA